MLWENKVLPFLKGNHVAKMLRSNQDKETWRQPEPVPVVNTLETDLIVEAESVQLHSDTTMKTISV